MADLPLHLQQLEPVQGAFEILRYLFPNKSADDDQIIDDLDMSSRRYDKAKRRLVTTGYVQMRSDYTYELTPKGRESATLLMDYDENAGRDDGKIQRAVVIGIPRNLVHGQTSALKIGFAPTAGFPSADLMLRLQALHATIGDLDENVKVDANAAVFETTITPQDVNQARVRLEVYQMTPDGEDVNPCGGFYVDLSVLPATEQTGEMIAYELELEFTA